MKRFIIITSLVVLAFVLVVALKQSAGLSTFLWSISNNGAWLLPLVLVSALLDSVHPCSFSILLITIAFLFGMQMTRRKILAVGGVYIAGIFTAYLLIGLGVLNVLHLFNTPHFMGKLGATLLVLFGVLNIAGALFPKFPIRLSLPSSAHSAMARLMERASMPAAFGLGLLVGICQFPCMGGPYLMVIGLLRDNVTYISGVGYLFLYNALLIAPLVAVLRIASDTALLGKMQEWKRAHVRTFHLWAGLAMVLLGIGVLFI